MRTPKPDDEPQDTLGPAQRAGSTRLWYCHSCWGRFRKDELTVVQEKIGRGFRCAECLEKAKGGCAP